MITLLLLIIALLLMVILYKKSKYEEHIQLMAEYYLFLIDRNYEYRKIILEHEILTYAEVLAIELKRNDNQ